MRTFSLSMVGVLAMVGCEAADLPAEAPNEAVDPSENPLEEEPVEETGEPDEGGTGTISGIVQVEIYGLDSRGEIETLSWEETYGEDFPFGSIFVAAYTLDDETGQVTYVDEYVIRSPDPEGNAYELKVDPEKAKDVRVYAILDYWGDGILSSNEPIGVWPDIVPVTSGAETPDINIDILAAYTDFTGGGGGGPGHGGGGGGGGDWNTEDYIWLSGDGLITEPYAGGSCVAMVYDEAGLGPYYADSFTPEQTEGGAEGEYGMWVAKNSGNIVLRGAWDANYNGLIDPADKWGQYVDETGSPVGAFAVGEVDLPDHTLMIPDGTDVNPSIVPFVILAGTLSLEEGDFASLDPGAQVHVAAMKYRPDTQISAADIPDSAYDYASFSGADLTGNEIPFTLIAPANTIVYFWAYLDGDGDGAVNEVGEQVGSFGGESSGRLATGTESRTDMAVILHPVVE